MKPHCSNQRNHALTLVEVLVVVAILTIIIAMILPALTSRHNGCQPISCINNLKQIGLSFRIWSGDNNDLYPMAVSVTNGGAMESIAAGNVAAVFQVMSNELTFPKILICPADKIHSPATNFENDFNNHKISYFAGLDATNESNSKLLLSGDDNFEIGNVSVKSGLREVTSNTPLAWDATRHLAYNAHFWTPVHNKFMGNIGLSDGSVSQWRSDDLQKAISQTGLATNRLVIP